MDIEAWLQDLGLERYVPAFRENEIDWEVLPKLTSEDLREIGVAAIGHRRKLLDAIAALCSSAPTAAVAAVSDASASGDAERRQLTVMFCDLVGSTAFAARLDPEELREVIRAYHRCVAEAVRRFEGFVAKYMGDGVLVYFGYPQAHEDDAERSVRAGLGTVEAVGRLDTPAIGKLEVRVGIATGLVVVGDLVGEGAAQEQAVVGETPNLAARLQALAEPGSVVIAPATRQLLGDRFRLQSLGRREVKGLAEPVEAWAVEGVSAAEGRFEAVRSGGLSGFVGREHELGLLIERWNLAQGGEGQVVLLSGEPGIGKSRIVSELRAQLEHAGARSLRLHCSPYYVNSAFYPIIDNFERALRFARDDTPEQKLDKLEALIVGQYGCPREHLRFIAAMLSIPCDERYGAVATTPQKFKDETLRVLVDTTEVIARRQPTVELFEDIHWADPTTLEVIDLLINRVRNIPLLVLLTYRPEFASRWSHYGHVVALTLSKLTRPQSSAVVSQLAGGKALPADLVEQILGKTDGVPLFVEELTKSILESPKLRDAGDRWEYAGRAGALAIPLTLRDSLMARLDRFAPVREIAQIGAAIGREFSYELIAEVAPHSRPALDQALVQLTQSGLAFQQGTPPDAVYTFKHALVQDAAYESLLKARRQQLHGRIARIIDERWPQIEATEPELIAHHYTEAQQPEKAIPLWQKAGSLALTRMALAEAIAHLSKGLELVAALPLSPQRDGSELNLRTLLGTAWMALGGWASPQAEASFSAALALARSLNHRPSYLPILYGLYVYHIIGGRIAESFGRAREMQELAEVLDDPELQMAEHMFAQCSNFYSGVLEESLRHGDRISALYGDEQGRHIERLTNQDPLIGRGIFGTPCLWMLGYPEKAVQLYTATERHARARGHPFGLSWVLTYGPWVFDLRGESHRALPILEEGVRLGKTHGIPLFSEVIGPIWVAIAWIRTGRLAEGIAQLRDGIAKWNGWGCHLAEPYFKSALAEGIARSGDLEQGLHFIEECLEMIERPEWQERVQLAEVLRLKGWMLQQRGKLTEAEQTLRSALEVARGQQARSWELRTATSYARLMRDQGRATEAHELLAPVYGWFTEGFDTTDLTEAKGLLSELR
jgi:class 3 adenylate cyclase/predicted ATPase